MYHKRTWLGILLLAGGMFCASLPVCAQVKNGLKAGRRLLRPQSYEQLRPVAKTSLYNAPLSEVRISVPVVSLQKVKEEVVVIEELLQNNSDVSLPVSSIFGTSMHEAVRVFPDSVLPKMDQVEAVIFDMDGTLLDSLPVWEHACANFLATQGIVLPEIIEEKIVRMSLADGAKYVKEQLKLSLSEKELLEGTLAEVRRHYANDILSKPGVVALLKRLHEQGIKICVATASHKDLAEMAFKRLNLMKYIDFIISCDEVGVGKMAPDVYETALVRLGTPREHTLVVEDALYALRTAKAAGFVTVGVADRLHSFQYEKEAQEISDYFLYSFHDWLRE